MVGVGGREGPRLGVVVEQGEGGGDDEVGGGGGGARRGHEERHAGYGAGSLGGSLSHGALLVAAALEDGGHGLRGSVSRSRNQGAGGSGRRLREGALGKCNYQGGAKSVARTLLMSGNT